MVTLNYTLRTVTHGFIDDRRIERSADRAKQRAQRQPAAWIRVVARRSIRKRKGYSKPGQPPSSHHGALKGGIFYVWDRTTKSTVVGPVRMGSRRGSGQVPELLEKGGTIRQVVRRKGRPTRRYSAHYEPRPYMAPALAKARQQGVISRGWKDAMLR